MYAPGPSDEELAAIGITREDVEDTSVVEVWPENELAFSVFSKLTTQWVVGQAGPVGLNYDSVVVVMNLLGVGRKKMLRVFDEIRVMEGEALRQMTRK